MLDISAITAPAAIREKNRRKDPWRDGFAGPCLICDAPVKDGSGVMVHLHGGGGTIVTEAEARTMDGRADLGGYPIGPECYRFHKAVIKPYADDFKAAGYGS